MLFYEGFIITAVNYLREIIKKNKRVVWVSIVRPYRLVGGNDNDIIQSAFSICVSS